MRKYNVTAGENVIHTLKKLFKSKVLYVVLSLLIQLAFLVALMTYFSREFLPVYYLSLTISVLACILVINRNSDTSSKLLWVFLIMGMPFFGGPLYLMFGNRKIPKALMIRDRQADSDYKKYALNNMKTLHKQSKDPLLTKMTSMAWSSGYFPVYTNSRLTYYPTGESQFAALLERIKAAKRFIFIETYILDQGVMWDQLVSILSDKAKSGVDVRLIYDDFGSSINISDDYASQLSSQGIKTQAFNPLRPQLAMQLNNRDHRKIIVIDGEVAFTGGSNIADEYINQKKRFGYWKDMGLMVQGEAVELFTISFLQIWNYSDAQPTPYENYVIDSARFDIREEGYIIPFSDSPTDEKNTGKNMHLNMILNSTEYCWISTPYLVLDSEMMAAIRLAVNNGVDVRIVVPGIPDKKMVYSLTKANIASLVKEGVRVYEYTPGFIHGKVMVSDDKQALVGTVNMDFRSYYYNYECGVWVFKNPVIPDIKKDFQEIFAQSHEVRKDEVEQINPLVRIYWGLLNIISPLL